MQIPEELKVGGHIYEVIQNYKFVDHPGNPSGQCDSNLLRIKLAGHDLDGHEKSKSIIFQTFIHEVLHALCICYGIQMKHSDENDELDRLAEGIFALLVDNGYMNK